MNREYQIKHSYEPSAKFFHFVVNAFGGANKFYNNFLISPVSPIGFIVKNKKSNWVNFNYYDRRDLEDCCNKFILKMMDKQLKMNIKRDTVICLGKGKNHNRLNNLNEKNKWFDKIIPLENPRCIIQYKRTNKMEYIQNI